MAAPEAPRAGRKAGEPARRVQSNRIYLPKVLHVDDGQARELDYDTDILAKLDWRDFDPTPIVERIPDNAQPVANQIQRISLTDDAEHFAQETVAADLAALDFDPAYAVRQLEDLVPNPFVARRIMERALKALRMRGLTIQDWDGWPA